MADMAVNYSGSGIIERTLLGSFIIWFGFSFNLSAVPAGSSRAYLTGWPEGYNISFLFGTGTFMVVILAIRPEDFIYIMSRSIRQFFM